jgi:hypothetical protein
MPAFRSIVSVLVRFVGRSFSTSSRPALRAAASGGRPRAGSDVAGHRDADFLLPPRGSQRIGPRSLLKSLVLSGR